ncbi:unnamed protein product [Periconia digitata]|uniref:Uncharacterized protein n=1 Tax=Periconia digitata TaxID=1303443 RepID=A0A9W4UR15_9PLEO|nr:unnamed protein product [Periconia digitata]
MLYPRTNRVFITQVTFQHRIESPTRQVPGKDRNKSSSWCHPCLNTGEIGQTYFFFFHHLS